MGVVNSLLKSSGYGMEISGMEFAGRNLHIDFSWEGYGSNLALTHNLF